jgi:pimeloyl-ACP methyl ester carboxylesterase
MRLTIWCASLLLAACAAQRAEPAANVDCVAALEAAGDQPLALSGAWRGEAVGLGQTTRLELHVADGHAFASMPDRAQFDFPVRAAAVGEDALCVAAPFRRGHWLLQRDGRDWRGLWTDQDFQAALTLDRMRRAALPRERELNFVSADGARLAGTLVLPAAGEGPFPVIVWVHGSAPTTRSTWFYRGRARMLARQGIASLIWDKRGAGASTGEQPWHIDRLSLDAQAAIAAARAAPETADDKVIIAGFSQGGWIAPRVAADNPWLAGVLVGAAPGITIAEQNVFAFEQALIAENIPADLTERAVGLVSATYEYYRTGLLPQYAVPGRRTPRTRCRSGGLELHVRRLSAILAARRSAGAGDVGRR